MSNFRSGDLVRGAPLGMNVRTVNLTADNQAVTVVTPNELYSWLQVSSDDTTAANRTFTLAASALVGHTLLLSFVSGGATTAQLADTGAVKLSAAWEPVQYQTLTLVSDGTNWLETSRSAN